MQQNFHYSLFIILYLQNDTDPLGTGFESLLQANLFFSENKLRARVFHQLLNQRLLVSV